MSSQKNIIVSKFGGSSMANFKVMEKAAKIVCAEQSSLVVVSATFKTTDQLLYLLDSAVEQNWNECVKKLFALKEKHFDIVSELREINAARKTELKTTLKKIFKELETILHGICLLGDYTRQAKDKVLSFGEQLSSQIFHSVLIQTMPSKSIILLDARDYIITDEFFNEAEPIPELIADKLKSLDFKNNLYITQGFIGSTAEGQTTTLGRGGSDYSAALFAEGCIADLLKIWTDIDGVNTTDPRICKSSRRIEDITYDEASELAYLGAKVLHPVTLLPTKRADIPVYIGSTLVDNSLGTMIHSKTKSTPIVRGITSLSNLTKMIFVNSNHLKGYQFLNEVIPIIEKNKIEVLGLNSTFKNISFYTQTNKAYSDSFQKDLKKLKYCKVECLSDDLSFISIVGNNLHEQKILDLLEGQKDILTIYNGASANSISFTCHAQYEVSIIQNLHERFFQ